MKEWLVEKTGNLSEWVEKMIYKAHQSEYCFWCFDDNIIEVHHGWVCKNDRHRQMAGRGAPSVVLAYKECPNCKSKFNARNMPCLMSEPDEEDIITCGMCKDEYDPLPQDA
tara:strand:+ start:182 stop:514 length:333 start_codon:yes stop_codon:yes gene_type:complete